MIPGPLCGTRYLAWSIDFVQSILSKNVPKIKISNLARQELQRCTKNSIIPKESKSKHIWFVLASADNTMVDLPTVVNDFNSYVF